MQSESLTHNYRACSRSDPDAGIPFLMQSWWMFVLNLLIFVGVSLKTPPPPPAKLTNLCLSAGRAKVGVGGAAVGDVPSFGPGPGTQSDSNPVASNPDPGSQNYSDWNDGPGDEDGGGVGAVLVHVLAVVLLCTMCGLIYTFR